MSAALVLKMKKEDVEEAKMAMGSAPEVEVDEDKSRPAAAAAAAAQEALERLVSQAAHVQAFKGRWMVISSRAQRICDALRSLQPTHYSAAFAPTSAAATADHAHLLQLRRRRCPLPSPPPPPDLSSILSAAHDALLLAQHSIDLSYGGGKLLMQSKLDAIATKLDLHLRDLDVLRCAIKQQERAMAIAMSSTTCRALTPAASSSIMKTISCSSAGNVGRSRQYSSVADEGLMRNEMVLQVWDLFARLRVGSSDAKKKTLQDLIQFLSDDGGGGAEEAAADAAGNMMMMRKERRKNMKQVVVAMAMRQQSRELRAAELGRLVHLLDSSSQTIKEKASHVVSLLCVSPPPDDSFLDVSPTVESDRDHVLFMKRSLVTELAAHSALIRVADSGTPLAKDKAALSLLHLTSVAENAHSVAAHAGAVSALAALCRAGHPPYAAASAAGALRNIAAHEHLRRSLADDETIRSLIAALAPDRGAETRCNAAEAICNLASRGKDDRIRSSVGRLGGIPAIILLLQTDPSDYKSQEIAVRALTNLASPASNAKALVAAGFVAHLTQLLRSGNPALQHLAASAVCALSPYIDIKKQLGSAGCIAALTEILDGGGGGKASASGGGLERQVAAQALSTLFLANSNRKELCKAAAAAAEGGEERVGEMMLEPRSRAVAKRIRMSALWAWTGGKSAERKRIAGGGGGGGAAMEGGGGRGKLLRLLQWHVISRKPPPQLLPHADS